MERWSHQTIAVHGGKAGEKISSKRGLPNLHSKPQAVDNQWKCWRVNSKSNWNSSATQQSSPQPLSDKWVSPEEKLLQNLGLRETPPRKPIIWEPASFWGVTATPSFLSKIRFPTLRFSHPWPCNVPKVAMLFSFHVLLLGNLISSFDCSYQTVEFIAARGIFPSRAEDSRMPQKIILILREAVLWYYDNICHIFWWSTAMP